MESLRGLCRRIKSRSGSRELKFSLSHSGLVTLFVMLAFTMSSLFDSALLVASLGSSAFVTFTAAGAETSRPRHLIGGYLCGSICGLACCFLRWTVPVPPPYSPLVFCAFAVFLTGFCLNFFAVGHPPSVALSVTLVLSNKPVPLALTALACIAMLCVCRSALLWFYRQKGIASAAAEVTESIPITGHSKES